MKSKIFMAICLAALLASCGGNTQESTGKKFNPGATESTSTLSDSERAAAIAAKKASLMLNTDSILMFDGVKFSVMAPQPTADMSNKEVQKIYQKILGIAAQNGVGGLATNPVLGLLTDVSVLEHAMTNTAPQKAVVKYEFTLYCGNFLTNEIYASASTTVTGVGNDFTQATNAAINELKNTPALTQMFRTASENAIKWYNNVGNLTTFVDQAVANRNYALAMALLSNVPVQAEEGRKYAEEKNPVVTDLFFQDKANELLSQMQSAIAASPEEYSPEVGALFSLIPHNAAAYPEALKAFEAYTNKLEVDRKDLIARQRAVEDRDAANAQMLAMEELQVQKVKAPYEMQATIEQIRADARVGVAQANAEGKKNANTGGFLGLGKLWDGAFGIANRLLDGLED